MGEKINKTTQEMMMLEMVFFSLSALRPQLLLRTLVRDV
jgi:hypothetical protein